jgi:hypothetical protein
MCLVISEELENIFALVSYIEPLQSVRYSFLKLLFAWCFSWLRMYRITESNCECK